MRIRMHGRMRMRFLRQKMDIRTDQNTKYK